uniref:Retrovirus-related Pol polyprotein from transposon TNT 1-94 n=2 Tax=Nicotiana TaxID=4085 RepID=A0A1S4ABY2_TOBAC|nr:PREDICTED: uncharacterized protein LOC104222405 [Nicotiana sylvestris]XP_016474124.1 PREDICTED: uncharacterized protein LOC107795933 [Nicotiana tabacum]
MERFKARLVAKGYIRKEGLDYSETYLPVAKMVTVRSIISLIASKSRYIFSASVLARELPTWRVQDTSARVRSGQVKGIGGENPGLYILQGEAFHNSSTKYVEKCLNSIGVSSDSESSSSSSTTVNSSTCSTSNLWNKRLGHSPVDIIKKAQSYSACNEPQSFLEASNDSKWVDALKLDIATLEDNHTWSIMDLSPRKKLIGCR